MSGVHIAFSWELYQQNGRLLDRLDEVEATLEVDGSHAGLAVGDPAPGFVLPDLDGRSVALDELLAARRGALLFFTNPGCAACNPILPALGRAQAVFHGIPVGIISTGDVADNRARAAEHGLTQVLLQDGFEVAESYAVYGSPAAVLVDPLGRIGSERALGAVSVTALLEEIASPLQQPATEMHATADLMVAR